MARPEKKTKTTVVWVMAVLILIPGSLGFGEKLYQFFHVLSADDTGRFTLVPILAYVLISLGFIFMIAWGAMKGMFTDVEGPKYRMLEREAELDKLERTGL